jgi:hypothetical protein
VGWSEELSVWYYDLSICGSEKRLKSTTCIYRSYEKHQQKLLEIRSSKKNKQGIVIENEVIDEVQNIRLKSNEFREIGKQQEDTDICSQFYFI